MDFCVDDVQLEKLEALLLARPDDVQVKLELAWALRQRDGKRALLLAQQVQESVSLARAGLLRLDLIRGELFWLNGELESALVLANSALQGFTELQDDIGCADAHWLRAWIAVDQGEAGIEQVHLKAMAAASADPTRICIAQAAQARDDAFRDVNSARERWGKHFPDSSRLEAAAACWVEDFHGLLPFLSGDPIQAIRHYSKSHALALATGQYRRAMTLALNLGLNLGTLSEHNTALDWHQRALDLARRCGWRAMIGIVLMGCGHSLFALKRLDASQQMLGEALELMSSMQGSRNYAFALRYLGDVELERKEYARALARYEELQAHAKAQHQPDLIFEALHGKANALNQLQQALPAQQMALAALAQAPNVIDKTKALRTLAAIHANHNLPFDAASAGYLPDGKACAPANLVDGVILSPMLHYLYQVLQLAATVEHFIVPGEVFDDIASEYARLGRFDLAYEFAKQAAQARTMTHGEEASKRANALQASHESEKALAAAESAKQVALVEAQRAQLLQQTNETLQNLGDIGQEITAHLAMEPMFEALHGHLHGLLQDDSFVIYLLDESGEFLKIVYCAEDGRVIPNGGLSINTVSMSHPHSHVVRCVREGCEVMIENPAPIQNWVPDTLQTLSAMFAPLRAADKILGVMTIQSCKAHAYGTREHLIFRTLSAYTAIAIANCLHVEQAIAQRLLQESQRQVIQQEKMATLGQLVSNIAHEINTPIGAIKSSGETIRDALDKALLELPALLLRLAPSERDLFLRMVAHSKQVQNILSSREERAIIRILTSELEQASVEKPNLRAAALVMMHAQACWRDYLPLLTHAESDAILHMAQSLAAIFSGSTTINTAVSSVSRIVFALKSFSRVDKPGEMQPANLREGIDTVLTIYHNQIKKGTELVCRFEEIPPVMCSPDELIQVWVNLIHNALQAMHYQGTLTVSVAQRGEYAVVSVGDTGCGIAPEHREKIFTPFFTTKPTGEGSGLGLDITRKIIDKHHGSIDFVSELGVGTTFSVYLPLGSLALH